MSDITFTITNDSELGLNLQVNAPGNGVVGGTNTTVQFHNDGLFDGVSEFTYNKTSNVLSLNGTANIKTLNVNAISSFGNVGNVKITGGTVGQVLKTDGTGNLNWVTIGNISYVQGNGTGLGFTLSGNVTSGGNLTLTVPDAVSLRNSLSIGNISNITLNGNVNQYLNGTGSWANVTIPTGNIANTNYNGNSLTYLNGVGSWVNIALPTGNIANTNYNGNSFTYLKGDGTWANIAVPTVGNIAVLNLNGNANTWLRGNGVWSNIAVPTGNIGNINLNGSATVYLRGDGIWSNIPIPTGNIANTNYNGNGNTWLRGNGTWANIFVPTVGNISPLNLNGNSATFLAGNGSWINIAVPTGNIANTNYNGNGNTWLRGNGTWANIPVSTGNIGNVNLNGNTTQYLKGDGTWANIAIPTGNIANTNYNGNGNTWLRGNGVWSNIAIPTGNIANTNYNGNVNNVLRGDGTWGAAGSGSGTVTNVATSGSGLGFSLSGGPITTTGTITLSTPTDTSLRTTLNIGNVANLNLDGNVSNVLAGNGTWIAAATGTVTNVSTSGSGLGFSLSGGPITSTGILTLNTPTSGDLRSTLSLGNVANLNLDGNVSNVLSGTGTWIKNATDPAGSNTEIQFNNNGVFGSSANFYFTTQLNVRSTGTPIISTRFSNSALSAHVLARARGTISAPLPLQVNDIYGVVFAPYTGNGTGTLSGITGFSATASPYVASRIDVLPTSDGRTPGQSLVFGTTNESTNSSAAALTLDSNLSTLLSGNLRLDQTPYVPSTASSTGDVGQVSYDNDYIYICTAANTWKRASLTTW